MAQPLGELLRQVTDALQEADRQELGNLVQRLYGDIEGSLGEKDRQALEKLIEVLVPDRRP